MPHKNIFSAIVLTVLFALTGCDKDFEETNRNPNNPEEINPELLMVTIIRGTVNQMVNDAFSTGNIVAQQAAEIREPGTDRYQWGSFGVWSNGYGTLRNVQNLYDIANERNLDNYKGVALVMRALIFSRMTDCYGDLPYTEALKGKQTEPVYTPGYDRQEDIYKGLIAELTEANKLLSSGSSAIRNDILFGGDIMKWKRFANSLKLRLLLRQSNKVNPAAAMQEITNNPATNPIMLANTDNAVLKYVESPNLFPITGQRSGFFFDRRLSKTFADQLNAINDPRLPVFAQPTAESAGTAQLKWEGVRNGETDANLGSNIDKKVSAIGTIYYSGLQVPVKAEGLVMTVSEVKFILAEAALNGWITAGNAKTYYEDGIKLSVDYYKNLSATNINVSTAYLNQAGVAFDDANGLQQIGIQRWIALYFNDLQAWHEWKRTGIPNLTPSIVNNNNNRIPVRFQYPDEQQVTNRENYQEAVKVQGPDNINTETWWDKR